MCLESFVCLSICSQFYSTSYKQIALQFYGFMEYGDVEGDGGWGYFGSDPDLQLTAQPKIRPLPNKIQADFDESVWIALNDTRSN